jgi:hypothetical protein
VPLAVGLADAGPSREPTLPGHRTERERHGGIGGWRESVPVTVIRGNCTHLDSL